MNFDATWKQIAGMVGLVMLLASIVVAYTRADDQLQEHEQEISGHEQILQELVKARLAEDASEKAARAARNKVCRELREAGKIERGECPALED